jgi:hypothetical protein
MVRLSLVALVALVASVSTAHADRYVSLGIGKSDLGGGLSDSFDDTGAGAYRLSVGQSFGNWALEARLFGSDFVNAGASPIDGDTQRTISLGVGLRYSFWHAGPLSAYGKGGLTKTWLSADGFDHEGTGFDLGLGVDLGISLPFAQFSVFAEVGHQQTELRALGDRDLDGSIRTAMAGVSLGF